VPFATHIALRHALTKFGLIYMQYRSYGKETRMQTYITGQSSVRCTVAGNAGWLQLIEAALKPQLRQKKTKTRFNGAPTLWNKYGGGRT